MAVAYKIYGEKTEYAYCKALGIDTTTVDPYDFMMDIKKVEAAATVATKKLNHIQLPLSKSGK
jgi:hypothetical protein